MGLRETMNNNPAAVTGGAVVVMLLCLFLIYCQLSGGSTSYADAKLVYYDVKAKQVKLVTWGEGPQPDSPLADSADVFKARIFSCGECGEITDGMSEADLKSKKMFVGWIEQRPAGSEDDPWMNTSIQKRKLTDKSWKKATPEAYDTAPKCPNGKLSIECFYYSEE